MDEETRAVVNLLNSKYWKKRVDEYYLRVAKDSKLSETLRANGNTMFLQSNHDANIHEQIWKFYSLSIASAEKDSEVLALAYGNRSALLIHLCQYQPCIRDIDRAINITNNNIFKVKLLARKVKCLNALGLQERKSVLQEAQSLLDTINASADKKNLQNLLNKIKPTLDEPVQGTKQKDKTKELLDALYKKYTIDDFSFIDIQYNTKFGRHLIAKRDIKPGEVIFIETPYTKFLNIKKIQAYCSHCYATTWTNIPCDHCSWTMFCSEECKNEAWEKYHQLECSTYAYSQEDGNNTCKQLAIRILSLAIKEAGGIENLKAELKAFNECTDEMKGFAVDGKLQSTGFKSVYALSKDVQIDALEKHKRNTALVLRALARHTSILGENTANELKTLKQNENAVFIGALFYRLSKMSQVNRHQMWNGNYVCKHKLDRLTCWENECCTTGVYIAPITSLLNHNCDPNARRCFSNDHKVIIYALRPIKKGDQIFDCYQQEFYELTSIPRRRLLKCTYNLDCDCMACQEIWPHLMYLKPLTHLPNSDSEMAKKELQLVLEFKDLIPSTSNPNTQYSEKDIIKLGDGIVRAVKLLSPPSFITVQMIICMNTIFERLYGIWLRVPAECSKI